MKKRAAAKKTKRRQVSSGLGRKMTVSVKSAMVGKPQRQQMTTTISRTTRNTAFTGALSDIVTDNGGTAVAESLFFRLDQLPNYSEFTKLFEEYCIDTVKCTWVPAYSVNVQSGAGLPTAEVECRVPQLGFCANYTGGANPVASLENTWLECEGYEQHDFNDIVSCTIKPKALSTIYTPVPGAAYGLAKDKQWVSTTYPDVAHYGINYRVYDAYYNRLIYGISQPTGTMYITYTVSFRGPR